MGEFKIIEDPQELRKDLLDELKRSESTGRNFIPVYADASAIINFISRYKPKTLVDGTNGGYVFEYNGKLWGAVTTDRLHMNAKGRKYFIYQIEKIHQYKESPYFDLALEWINDKADIIKRGFAYHSNELKNYPTFTESLKSSPSPKKKLVYV